jgi:hypothetical protein
LRQRLLLRKSRNGNHHRNNRIIDLICTPPLDTRLCPITDVVGLFEHLTGCSYHNAVWRVIAASYVTGTAINVDGDRSPVV